MGYLLYSLSFAILIIATALYFTRQYWMPYMPDIRESRTFSHLYHRLPSSFTADMEAGFSSSTFDLNQNLEAGDSRAGLDQKGKREVQKIMKKKRVNFDEARRIWMQETFKKGGIGPDGLPRDPKLVTFG